MSKPIARHLPYHPLLYAYHIGSFWVVALLAGAVTLFLFGVLVFAHSLARPSQGDSSLFSQLYKVNSAHAAPAPLGLPSTTHLREMHIANNGAVFLKSTKITALSDKVLSVSMSWGSNDFLWTVRYSYLTSVLDKGGKPSNLSSLKVGDTITITGTLATGATEPTVEAQVIRKN